MIVVHKRRSTRSCCSRSRSSSRTRRLSQRRRSSIQHALRTPTTIFVHSVLLALLLLFSSSSFLPKVKGYTRMMGLSPLVYSTCNCRTSSPSPCAQRCVCTYSNNRRNSVPGCTCTTTALQYSPRTLCESSSDDDTAKQQSPANGSLFPPKKTSQPSIATTTGTTRTAAAAAVAVTQQNRRTVLATSLGSATAVWSTRTCATAGAVADTTTLPRPGEQATITQKVFIDVRISRQDGTFYVRDDLSDDTPENQVFQGRLTIGLFGNAEPNHVRRFLEYVTATATTNGGTSSPLDEDTTSSDTPLPSYSRSVFNRFDEGTGVLYGGAIPSLDVTTLPQGSTALQYGGRLVPAQLWINSSNKSSSTEQRLSHIGKGLLTHRNLDVTPVFGVTTRQDTTTLDPTHTVFGRLLLDPTATAFLNRVAQLPVYSVDRRPAPDNAPTIVDDAASAVFRAQRDLFRTTAQRLGDTRVQKLVAGKLLRRVEVTQVGVF